MPSMVYIIIMTVNKYVFRIAWLVVLCNLGFAMIVLNQVL